MSRLGIQTQEPTRTQLVDQTESLSTDTTDTEKQDPPLPQPSIVGTDWDGPEDLENPHNWPLWVRIYHATTPGLFGFAVTFGTSVYTPALADIMADFNVSRTAALAGIAVYTLGLAFGPIMSAPLSEKHGRKIVYLLSSPIFMLFTLGAGLSKSFASLIVCRFFAGLTGSPALAVGAGSNADLFPPHQRAKITTVFLMAPFAGPSLGPVVGGFAAQYKGWRWTQWCMIFVTLAVYIASFPMKETYKPIILARRAKRLGLDVKPAGNPGGTAMKRSIITNLFRPMHMLLTEPVVFFLSLYTAFAFGVLFLLFAAFPYIFMRPPYSFNISQSGLAFLAIGLGVVLGGLTGVLIDHFVYQAQYRAALARGEKHAAPEHRLYNAMMGSGGILIGLFWVGWSAGKGAHWAIVLVGSVPFAWGNLCLFTSAALYMTDVYGPLNGASAIAANGIFRYTLGAVFPLFTVQMYSSLGIAWATSLLGFLSVLMLPIPWIFYKWGPKIRARSRYPVVM
ncbi:MFS general substrate transporter [Lizonia empirigonia]|nr:MFS general substrate transporter [Lizonia empirigonia]